MQIRSAFARRALALFAAGATVTMTLATGPLAHGAATPEPVSCGPADLRGGYAISGQGQFSGTNIRTIARLVFDGAGKVTGGGVAALDLPSVAEPYDLTQGTYVVRPDCTGTVNFFVHHHTLSPIDHFHTAELVLADTGRSFDMIYTKLSMSDGGSAVPIEGILWTAHRQ